jgi:hypothetical protein
VSRGGVVVEGPGAATLSWGLSKKIRRSEAQKREGSVAVEAGGLNAPHTGNDPSPFLIFLASDLLFPSPSTASPLATVADQPGSTMRAAAAVA